ncbi:MAG: S-layer homology domain-containing protein [Clostridia bacterium]|nr:S-layer homology domain-containing protein [Clostridia bacterium]
MKRFISILLTLMIIFSLSSQAFAFDKDKVDVTLESVGNYLYETVKKPIVGSIGGEWTVLGLARSDMDISDEYFENYYQTVTKYVKDCGGVLHSKKYTEYSRVIVALTSIGKNPADVAGYNLLIPLGDYEKTIWQGINGAIWALIALDSGNYDMPSNPDAEVQATREMYINHILEKQTSDGGWALSGDIANPDVTGMALQALSKYQDNAKVKSATEKALDCLSRMQKENGGFEGFETENSESSVQVIVALCELDISAGDERFVKNGKSVIDNLFSYYDNGKGFKHIHGGPANLMATEQCFYALAALKRVNEGKNSLFDMSDAKELSVSSGTAGLEGKNADVQKMNILNPGKTFADIVGHKDAIAIEALASRGIINGKTENSFEPNSTMTRAEFATIIARGLGLPQKSNTIFKDVTTSDWFYDYVGTVYSYGIIKGISENEFNPNGAITREEAAVMVTRAAKLCGIDTEMDALATRDVLAQFFDYVLSSDWSQNSLAFCYNEKILDDSVMDIKPFDAVTRAEIASMLFNMLSLAKLL